MTLETEFYRGNYNRILTTTVDSPAGIVPAEAAAFVIGSLSFRGRLDEAEATWRLFQAAMNEEARFAARFFLGVGLCRHSHHARGRHLLARNLRDGARHPSAKIRFYAWQGAGYLRDVGCRYRDQERYSALALNAALEANFLYGKALASDLLAHSQVAPGQIQAAGENFRRALGYAELLGDGGLRQAVRVSLVIHSAAHGMDPANDIASLEGVAAELTSEDNYSKSRILLELGRQHVLRGAVTRAKASLDEACRLVYASQHRRHGIILNMRYAYIMHLAGEHLPALNLIRNAAKSLDPVVDRVVATEVVGLEMRLLEHVPCPTLDQERAQTTLQLSGLTRAMGRSVSQRILNRVTFRGYNHGSLIGDDPLGDLVDLSVSRSDSAVRRIVASGYLQLLTAKLNLAPGASGLYVDLLPGALLAFDRGDMHYVPVGVSNVIRTMLRCFAAGTSGKDELIQNIWHYNYNPLKHDQLIYTAVSRLRQLLGPYATWVEVTEAGYRLKPDVTLRFLTEGPFLAAEAAPAAALEEDGGRPRVAAAAPVIALVRPLRDVGGEHAAVLNHRQIGIVDYLKTETFVDARTCSVRFEVSEVSARRDLSLLTQLGVLRRHGKGRATRYSLLLNEPQMGELPC